VPSRVDNSSNGVVQRSRYSVHDAHSPPRPQLTPLVSRDGHSGPLRQSEKGRLSASAFRKLRCTLRQLVRLLARVVLRVDVGSPLLEQLESIGFTSA
jgi:hypothetical protein